MDRPKEDLENNKMKLKREFKDRLYRFVLQLIKFIDGLPKDRSTRVIADQLLKSGTSIGANYFESEASSSRKDFTNFFHHSLKSANESKFWLGLLRDSKRVAAAEVNTLLQEVSEIANILASSILTLKRKKSSQ